MPRIHIIGAPGSGKTTYACELANKLNLPLCCLDEIYHDNSGSKPRKRSETERTNMAKKFTAKQNWVSEGASFSNWINPILERATEIHIVSPSKITRVYRLIKRYIKRKLGVEKSTYNETLGDLWNGIKWTCRYERDTLPIILTKIPKRTKVYKIKR